MTRAAARSRVNPDAVARSATGRGEWKASCGDPPSPRSSAPCAAAQSVGQGAEEAAARDARCPVALGSRADSITRREDIVPSALRRQLLRFAGLGGAMAAVAAPELPRPRPAASAMPTGLTQLFLAREGKRRRSSSWASSRRETIYLCRKAAPDRTALRDPAARPHRLQQPVVLSELAGPGVMPRRGRYSLAVAHGVDFSSAHAEADARGPSSLGRYPEVARWVTVLAR